MEKFQRIVTLWGVTIAMGTGAMFGAMAYIAGLEKLTGRPINSFALNKK